MPISIEVPEERPQNLINSQRFPSIHSFLDFQLHGFCLSSRVRLRCLNYSRPLLFICRNIASDTLEFYLNLNVIVYQTF